ncbi:MAG: DUF2141 domain-containing protein [Kiloniellales bacterium]
MRAARIRTLVVLLLVLACASRAGLATETIELTVVIAAVRSDQGQVRVALWDRAEGFTDDDLSIGGEDVAAAEGEVAIRFAGLPPGRYALAAYHDENANGEFDLTWIGLPGEGLGFSNDARIFFGPPSFEAAAVELAGSQQTVRIALRY